MKSVKNLLSGEVWMMPDDAVTSECPGFGKDFNEDDSDCQGCKESHSEEHEACKALYEAKQAGQEPDPAVDEEDVSLDKEVDAAESEVDDDSEDESDELGVPIIPEEDDVEPLDDLDDVEPPEQELDEEPEPPSEPQVKSKKKEVVKKYRRIETFARLIRQGESWLPSELANAVDMEADKTYKPNVTTVVVTQWLKLLLLVGIAEKLDGGLYRLKAEFVGKIDG